MRSEWEANRAIDRYADLVRRVCMIHLKNHADTEDIFQTVFLKYVTGTTEFESEEHEKAWFIRVTINACKDLLRSFFRSRTVSLDDLLEQPDQVPEDHREVLEAVLALPDKYRDVVYLHYYEGYTAPEIGTILHKNPNTVYTLLTVPGTNCERCWEVRTLSKNLKEAFDSIHADPALKESTRAFLREKTGNYTAPEPRRHSGGFRRLAPALACVALLVVGLSGYQAYFTPTSAISIDINPSVGAGDQPGFDRVINRGRAHGMTVLLWQAELNVRF